MKQARLSKLMRVQQQISEEVQQGKVGKALQVVIDREEGDYYIGRTEFDSPEVDPEVLIKRMPSDASQGECLKPGQFIQAKIETADEFDLYGKAIGQS